MSSRPRKESPTRSPAPAGKAGSPAGLAERLRAGDRRALAQAITLIESTRADHREAAEALLDALLPHTGGSLRLGISGVPGVGKSTFIEALGLQLIAAGHRVAVLAVDPSSPRTGGSILGDKTRMDGLARNAGAFIRPSPAGRTLGGVARRTREDLLACEAAGFDVVIVETVGVGQSETAVADMVDVFLLLLAPGGGDELQGIKKGITELADVVVVNKADGDLAAAAERVRRDTAGALHLWRRPAGRRVPPVMICSARSGDGVAEVWKAVWSYRDSLERSGEVAVRRADQARAWMWGEVGESLIERLRAGKPARGRLKAVEAKVAAGEITPTAAARLILRDFLKDRAAGASGRRPGNRKNQ